MRAVLPPPFRRAQKTAAQGSPPREAASVPAACSARRGALRGSTGARANVTPAHAGKGSRTRWSRSWHTDRPRPCGECLLGPPFSVPRSDHPRVCGEKIWYEVPDEEKNGSPPRMRGKSSLPPDGNLSLRSTPHMRGTVLFCVIPVGMPPHGSPLPMQGKDLLRSPGGRKERITLAHAGKRAAPPPRCPGAEDHPRACGEKETDSSIAKRNSGSPRVYGEKQNGTMYQQLQMGSPPRVRGKDRLTKNQRSPLRIIPACAGKSRRKAA